MRTGFLGSLKTAEDRTTLKIPNWSFILTIREDWIKIFSQAEDSRLTPSSVKNWLASVSNWVDDSLMIPQRQNFVGEKLTQRQCTQNIRILIHNFTALAFSSFKSSFESSIHYNFWIFYAIRMKKKEIQSESELNL